MDEKLTKLSEMLRAVEAADAAWFEALKAGGNGKAEKAAYMAAKGEYREYESALIAAGTTVECGRCGGEGVVSWGVTVNVVDRRGRAIPAPWCFECMGAKVRPLKPYRFGTMAPTRMKHVRAYEAKCAAEAAKAVTNWDAFAAAEPEVAAFLATHVRPDLSESYDYGDYDDFLCSMREKVLKWGSLTEKMMAAVKRSMEREAEKAAEALVTVDFPRGTETVEGEIISVPRTNGYAGGVKSNMLVKLTSHVGNRVMGTIPEKVWRAMESDDNGENHGHLVGSKVRFTAMFKPSDGDEHFGYFKSPKGVEVLYVKRGEEG